MSWMKSVSLQATGTGTIGGTGSSTLLGFVNVNTGASSAVLTLRKSSSTGAVIATIDASAAGVKAFFATYKDGVYYALTGGNADITITFE